MEVTRNEEGVFVRAPAKLNLFLDVGAPGSDGYHPIDSIFQAISLFDELEFVAVRSAGIELQEEGMDAGEENIVYRAASRLREEVGGSFPSGVRISLRKSIPCAAGLGGGSSDAAATLFALRELWDLPVDSSRLLKIGEELGADVPFFFSGGTARCQGKGEIVTPLEGAPHGGDLHYVLVCPPVEASTRKVYEAFDASPTMSDMNLTLQSPIDSIPPSSIVEGLLNGELLFNRLEAVACELFTELVEIRDLLDAEGFRGSMMSGSGSTFFGLCRSAVEAASIADNIKGKVPIGTRVLTTVNVSDWSEIFGL